MNDELGVKLHNLYFQDIIEDLNQYGHITEMKNPYKRGSVIVGIVREGDNLIACADPRKGGGVTGG